jgi:nucleoside-diphosphate-sugar epimerase
LLDLARQADAGQFIFISTGAVHETILDDRPLDEAHPLWPHSTYGAYKAAVEAFLPAYREQLDFNACAFRPTSVYGLHLTRPQRSHWHDLVRRVARGERIATAGGGKVVHVEDVAQAVVGAVGRDDVAGEVYELTDCHIYDQTVAEFAKAASGSEAVIEDLKGAGPRHQIVSDKARRTFGVGLNRGHDGVRAYVEALVTALRRE